MTVVSRIASACFAFLALVTVTAGDFATAQDRFDRRVTVVNQTGRVIYSFHSTNKSVTVWGRDLLGQYIIRPGQTWTVNLDDRTGYCQFDLRAVLDTGEAIERYGVDVCTVGTWVVR